MHSIVLTSGELRLTLRPEAGGKLSSLISLPQGEELLAQPPQMTPRLSAPGIAFADGEAAGFDDVFPSMGEVACPGEWDAVPDHGVVWTSPMAYRNEDGVAILTLDSVPWHYEKRIFLQGNKVHLDWRIRHVGDTPASFIWVCHGLWRLEAGMYFFFPDGEAMDVLNQAEPAASMPDRPIPDGTMAKLYLSHAVSQGCCGFVWPERRLRMTMTFDPQELPYLGFWITNGGWRGDRNFAFEPATALYDTMACARRTGTLTTLSPGEDKRFSITLTISHEPI